MDNSAVSKLIEANKPNLTEATLISSFFGYQRKNTVFTISDQNIVELQYFCFEHESPGACGICFRPAHHTHHKLQ
jgi:hypothetical protein